MADLIREQQDELEQLRQWQAAVMPHLKSLRHILRQIVGNARTKDASDRAIGQLMDLEPLLIKAEEAQA